NVVNTAANSAGNVVNTVVDSASNSVETVASSAANTVNSAAAATSVSLQQQFPESMYTPPQMPSMPPSMPLPPNPMTPLRPGLILHHLIKRCIMAAIRILKTILHRIQDWVLRTS